MIERKDKLLVKALWISEENHKKDSLITALRNKVDDECLKIIGANDLAEIEQLVSFFDFDVVVIDFSINRNFRETVADVVLYETHMSEIPLIYYSEFLSTNLNLIMAGRENSVIVYEETLVEFLLHNFFNHKIP